MFWSRPRQITFCLYLHPIIFFSIVIQIYWIKIRHISFQYLIASIHIKLFLKSTSSAITSYTNIFAYYFTLSPSLKVGWVSCYWNILWSFWFYSWCILLSNLMIILMLRLLFSLFCWEEFNMIHFYFIFTLIYI